MDYAISPIIAYVLYFTGLILLSVPSGFFVGKRLSIASLSELADSPRQRRGCFHLFNAIDLARAFAGMTLLQAGFTAYEPTAPYQLITNAMLAMVALLGLSLQHGFYPSKHDELPAPMAYILGLVLAVLPLKIAILALPLGIATAFAAQNLSVGLALSAIAAIGLGKLLGTSILLAATGGTLLFLPVFIAMVFQRRLGLTIRRQGVVRYPTLREFPVENQRTP